MDMDKNITTVMSTKNQTKRIRTTKPFFPPFQYTTFHKKVKLIQFQPLIVHQKRARNRPQNPKIRLADSPIPTLELLGWLSVSKPHPHRWSPPIHRTKQRHR